MHFIRTLTLATRFTGYCVLGLLAHPLSTHAAQNTITPAHPLFKGVQEVGLYVVEPYWHEVAVRCHGIEERCADENPGQLDAENRDNYIKELKETYADYPEPLRLKALQDAFGNALKREFAPFLSAQIDVPILLDEDTVDSFSQKKGALTVTVSLHFVDNVTPHVAIISMDYYTPDCEKLNRQTVTHMPRKTAVPLSLSSKEVEAHIAEFLRGFNVYSTQEVLNDPVVNESDE